MAKQWRLGRYVAGLNAIAWISPLRPLMRTSKSGRWASLAVGAERLTYSGIPCLIRVRRLTHRTLPFPHLLHDHGKRRQVKQLCVCDRASVSL